MNARNASASRKKFEESSKEIDEKVGKILMPSKSSDSTSCSCSARRHGA